PFGALIYYYLADQPSSTDTVRLEFIDSRGELVKAYTTHPDKSALQESRLSVSGGLNRFQWNMTGAKPEILPGSFMSLSYTSGHSVPPGNYGAQLSVNDEIQTVYFEVQKDPRWEQSNDDLIAQHKLVVNVMEKLNETHDAIHQIRSVREQSKEIASLAVDAGYDKAISEKADELAEKLTAIEDELIQTKSESGQDPINYPPMLDDQFAYLYSTVNFQDSRPTAGAYERFEDLKKELSVHLTNLDEIMASDFKAFNDMLDSEGVSRIIIPKR
ncbi:MAG: glycosyl hydrolase, partial [Bacteroidota bacterium]